MITKRSIMGIKERVESAIERLPNAQSTKEVADIVETDLMKANEDLDYLMEMAD